MIEKFNLVALEEEKYGLREGRKLMILLRKSVESTEENEEWETCWV